MKYIVMVFILLTTQLTHAAEPEKNIQMPAWALYTDQGKLIKSSDFANKPLILHFWGTWCPYCKRLQPGLEKLRKTYESKGLQFIAISINESENAKPQAELNKRGIHITNVEKGDSLALEKFNIHGTPTTFFIAPNNTILGSTMESDPENPQFTQVAEYLLSLPRS